MRIGIDGSCWSNRRGFGRFTRCLVTAMHRRDERNRLVLVIDEPSARGADLPQGLDTRVVRVDRAPARAAAAGGRRSIRDVWRMSRAATAEHCDVFFFPASYSFYPVLGTRVVVTIHDAIPERLPEMVVPTRAARLLWKAKQRASVWQADAVLTVSEASRAAIADSLGVPSARLHVVREAPDPRFRPMPPDDADRRLRRFGLDGTRYVLYVGGISPHKNVETLIGAFELLPDVPDVRLLVAGDADDDPFLSSAASVRARVAASRARHRILLTGYVSDDELVALYNGAVATVLPSLGEGFGLTAAESAACGTPVVASGDPALRELLGDAGLYADARDAAAFAEHLRELLDDAGARERAGKACLEKSREWSWDAAADATLALLEGGKRRRG